MRNKMHFFYCIATFTAFICLACSSKYSKENHIVTFKLDDSLYIEKYKVFSGGATTSDSYSYYLTDSVHFRKYIETEHYSDEQIFWDIKDSNEVSFYLKFSVHEKKKDIDIDFKVVSDTTKIGRYYIRDLVKEGKFE